MARLQEKYNKEIVGRLSEKLGRKNRLSLPRLQKIVVNMGVGKALQDKNRMEQAAEHLTQITGQRAQITKAKVAVSGFRLRGRPGAVYRKFGICRICFRDMASNGLIPGVKKASW